MSSANRRTGPIALALLLVASLAVGCSSSGRTAESEKAVEGFQKTREAITKAQGQVDQTNTALDRLAAGGDLQKSYKTYNSSVSDLEKTAEGARKRAQGMRERVHEYTTQWEKEIDTMKDPTIRAGLTQRREAVRENFDKVKNSAQAAREAYQPYLAGLKEIQKALAIDLTPANATALKPAIEKTRRQGDTLKQKLAAMQAELDNIVKGTSPTGTAGKS